MGKINNKMSKAIQDWAGKSELKPAQLKAFGEEARKNFQIFQSSIAQASQNAVAMPEFFSPLWCHCSLEHLIKNVLNRVQFVIHPIVWPGDDRVANPGESVEVKVDVTNTTSCILRNVYVTLEGVNVSIPSFYYEPGPIVGGWGDELKNPYPLSTLMPQQTKTARFMVIAGSPNQDYNLSAYIDAEVVPYAKGNSVLLTTSTVFPD